MMKLLIYAIIGLVLAMSVAAQPMPAPVAGYVEFNGFPVDNVNVVVKNTNTGEVLTVEDSPSLRTEKGRFAFDLGRFEQGYFVRDRRGDGDVLEVTVCSVVPECVLSFELAETSGIRSVSLSPVHGDLAALIEIREVEVIKEVEKEVIKEVLVNGTEVVEVEVIREVEVPADPVAPKEIVTQLVLYKCVDGSTVEIAEDCPAGLGVTDNVFYGALALVNVVLGALGVQWHRGFLGLAKYYWKKGERVRALKMLLTTVKRAKDEKYYLKKYIKK